MSMSDPIADLLTRIRNAQMVAKATVSVPASNIKVAIAQVLKDEGYIDGFQVKKDGNKSELEIALKYYAGRPVIARSQRHERHHAPAGEQHGAGRDQGLREEAEPGRRGLQGPGARRQAEPHGRLFAPGQHRYAAGHHGGDAGADRDRGQGRRSPA